MAIEHYIDDKTTGIITPNTKVERDRARAFVAKYNAHYESNKKITFKNRIKKW